MTQFDDKPAAKKEYKRPHLEIYGDLREVTKRVGNVSNHPDPPPTVLTNTELINAKCLGGCSSLVGCGFRSGIHPFRTMPTQAFFRHLGLFVHNGFLEVDTCLRIQAEMRTAESTSGTIISSETQESILDEDSRKVLCVDISAASKELLIKRLLKIKPKLEEHFHVRLTGGQGPDFLRYNPGAFYRPHLDASPGAPPKILKRRVSAVIFLNAESKEPMENCYGGGALTFYGLLPGREWGKLAFSLEAEPGMLVAFRSDTRHEVQPVTFGQRFTIVSWFIDDQDATSADAKMPTAQPAVNSTVVL